MKPFLQGKKSLADNPPLRVATAPAAVKPAAHLRPHVAASCANVEVVKEGDKVVRIIVTCSCGEKTEIDCIYPGRG